MTRAHDELTQVPMTKTQKAKLRRIAGARDVSMSEVVRGLVDAAPEPTRVTTGTTRRRERA